MIVVKLISGLGNQLFQYTVGRQLSLIKNVPLKLDISFFESQSLRAYKLDHYNIQATIASPAEIETFFSTAHLSSLQRAINKAARKLNIKKASYLRQSDWWAYDPSVYNVSSRCYLDGYWQHHKYFEDIHPRIFEELTLKGQFSEEVQKMTANIQENPSSVSIHIRRGDYIFDKEANSFQGVLPLDYYYSALNYISSKVADPFYYIFSDDLNWVKDNLKISDRVEYVDIEGGKLDYVELDLMSRCKHNVTANSSFSWWAALLNKNPDKIVIIPNKWVVPEDINNKIKLQFPSWVRL